MTRIEKTVFISYRRTNFPWAYCIYQDLTHHGYDVFFDYQSIDSGSFEKVILENIKARAHFIIILSPSALERCNQPGDWLRREIETAIDENRNIIPVMLEGFDFGSPLVKQALTGKLASLGSRNGMSLVAEYVEAGFEKLRTRFLNVAIQDVQIHNLPEDAKEFTTRQQTAANEAPPVENKELSAQEWFERGYVFTKDKNFDEAIRCYNEAINLDPKFNGAYFNLGYIFRELKRYKDSEAAYRKAIEAIPTHARAYGALGYTLSLQKRINEAEMAYRKAFELDPSSEGAYYYNLACLRTITGNFESAFENLEKAAKFEEFNARWAWQDPDLQWIRDDPRFFKIVGEKPR